jgi:hypothetical protein
MPNRKAKQFPEKNGIHNQSKLDDGGGDDEGPESSEHDVEPVTSIKRRDGSCLIERPSAYQEGVSSM